MGDSGRPLSLFSFSLLLFLPLSLLFLFSSLESATASFVLECCHDGVSSLDDCTCLEDNDELHEQVIPADGFINYHWIMTDFSITDVPDANRSSITFRVSPCVGNLTLYVRPVSLPWPGPSSYRFMSDHGSDVNAISIQLFEAQYFVSVYGDPGSEFSMVAQMDGVFPSPANGGVISAEGGTTDELVLDDDPLSMDVTFTTVDAEGEFEYTIYAVPSTGACSEANSSACILTTECGLDRVAVSVVGPLTGFGRNEEVTVNVPGIERDVEHTFNVVVRRKNGDSAYASAYTATKGTAEYERNKQLHSNDTVIMVASISGGVVALLIILIVYAKIRLNRAFRKRQAEKRRLEKEEQLQANQALKRATTAVNAGVLRAGAAGEGKAADEAKGSEGSRPKSSSSSHGPPPGVAGVGSATGAENDESPPIPGDVNEVKPSRRRVEDANDDNVVM